MRGLNLPMIWFDEFAFLSYNEVVYLAAKPALTKAAETAKANNKHTGIVITTTPNNLDLPEGNFAYNIRNKAARFSEEWYNWTDEQLADYIEKNSSNTFVYIEFQYYELGRDEKWYNQQVKEMLGNMLLIKREILLEWTFASSLSIFNEEQLDMFSNYVKESQKNICNSIFIQNYEIKVLKLKNNLINKNWALSIDIGGGLGRDYSAFNLIDPLTYESVMTFKNNNISVLNFADLVTEFVKTYVPKAVIIPERQNQGVAFIEKLIRNGLESNLYYYTDNNKLFDKKVIKESIFHNKKNGSIKKVTEKRHYGFNTIKETREIMTKQILFMIAEERPYLVNNQELFEEFRTLVYETSGKINHLPGSHDDLTMSYLIGLCVLIYDTKANKFFRNISDEAIEAKNNKNKKLTSRERTLKNISNFNNKDFTSDYLNDSTFKNIEMVRQRQNLLNEQKKEKVQINSPEEITKKKILNIFKLNN